MMIFFYVFVLFLAGMAKLYTHFYLKKDNTEKISLREKRRLLCCYCCYKKSFSHFFSFIVDGFGIFQISKKNCDYLLIFVA